MIRNILFVNKFFYKRGGSETHYFDVAKLLIFKGYKLVYFSMKHPKNLDTEYEKYFVDHIDFFDQKSLLSKFKNSANILYSFEAEKKMKNLLQKEKIDIAHLHNIAHQISPSVLNVLKRSKIPVIMTLHDFKLVCGSYSMLSQGKLCESCKGGKYYNSLYKKCKGSFVNNLLLTSEMYFHHKILRIYDNVDLFISPSKFLISKIREMGFKGEIAYLPNFIDSSSILPNYSWSEESIVYFGRLSFEKGIETMIDAVRNIDVQLKIIGEGVEKGRLVEKIKAEKIKNVHFLGYKKGRDLQDEIKKSMFVILPSKCYENNPYSVIEAFALGKPVIGSRIGGIPELVKDNETGLTFIPENADDLSEKIKILLNNKKLISDMGKRARAFIEEKLSPEKYYRDLMLCYEKAKQNSLNK